jgi:hypothetical protein
LRWIDIPKPPFRPRAAAVEPLPPAGEPHTARQ